MKYRKKPIVIDAVRFDGERITDELYELAKDSSCKLRLAGAALHVDTLEGTMTASPGDYIIRGVKGELYPCRADIFEATYEVVS